MKYLVIILFLLPCFINAQEFPDKPANYITDETNYISIEDQSKLNSKLKAFEDSTSNQIFVYVAYTLNGKNLEQYSEDIFHHWKIGQGEKNNGILIAIFVDDHKFRIQTGYGLEGALPDLLTKHIQDNDMRPLFKLNRYYEGVDKGIDQLIYYSKHEFKPDDIEESHWGILIFFYTFSAILMITSILLASGIKDKPGKKKLMIILSIVFFLIPFLGSFVLVFITFLSLAYRKDLLKPVTRNSDSSSSWSSDNSSSWSSSSSDSSSSSSDFSGGGGGDSGGGGSSSDW